MSKMVPLLLLPIITACRGRLSAAGFLGARALPIASSPG